MVKCVVELIGLPKSVTELRSVEVDLNEGARLIDLVATLKHKIPSMEGTIIRSGADKLTERYVFNINGRFYIDDNKLQLKSSDHIVLLTLAIGG